MSCWGFCNKLKIRNRFKRHRAESFANLDSANATPLSHVKLNETAPGGRIVIIQVETGLVVRDPSTSREIEVDGVGRMDAEGDRDRKTVDEGGREPQTKCKEGGDSGDDEAETDKSSATEETTGNENDGNGTEES